MEFGKRIQKKRKQMGLTTDQLAKMARCSTGRIQQFEAGLLPEHKNSGALARVKRILKVRVRDAKPAKRTVKRGRKPGRPVGFKVEPALNLAIKALHMEVAALGRTIAKLSAKVSVPTKMIREAKVVPPLNGSAVPHPQAETPVPLVVA